jgi:AcrR family transcriptional regulator
MTPRRRAPQRRAAGSAVLSDEVTEAIRDAVFAELAETGYARMSMEAVARRARAGKAAIYRRWPSKAAMVLAMVSQVAANPPDFPDTGSLRGDILKLLELSAAAFRLPTISRIVPDLLAEGSRDPEFGAEMYRVVGEPRRALGRDMIVRAVERGELDEELDMELVLDFIPGPLYWRLAVTRREVSAEYLERLTDVILAGIRASAVSDADAAEPTRARSGRAALRRLA